MASKLTIIPGSLHFNQDSIMVNGSHVPIKSQSYSPSNLFVMSTDGVHLPVMGNNSSYNQHTYYAIYDPLIDHMAWYGRTAFYDRQLTFQISEIEGYRVWRRAEFDTWFETECKNVVFAQTQVNTSWTLTFVDLEDYEAFRIWWFAPRGSKMEVMYPFDTKNERIECDAFVQEIKEWCTERLDSKYAVNTFHEYLTAEFESENEALMFKLAWNDRARVKPIIQ